MRHFDCPLCGDKRARAWVQIERWTAGCFNDGCLANDRLSGGALELVRIIEELRTRGAAKLFLLKEFPASSTTIVKPAPSWKDSGYADWCRLPKEMRPFKSGGTSVIQTWFVSFASVQWGIGLEELAVAGAGFCMGGKHAWRIIFPIVMYGQVVAFQGRAIRGGEPKYLTSRRGFQEDKEAECGRPSEACLYNYDAIKPGCIAVMEEGIGDVLRTERNVPWGMVPFALLGTSLTQEKLSLIVLKKPGQVVVALDNELEARQRAIGYMEAMIACGMSVQFGVWVGGKDAGTGATLKRLDMDSYADRSKLQMGLMNV